jgi:predicted DNA-binding transcriptional regulator
LGLVLQEDKERVVESELKGVTLRAYWHILGSDNKENIGVRQIQRELGLSSPSVALHHLEKLRTLGLLEKGVTGDYKLVGQVKVGVLKNFVGLLGILVPRYMFYATMFTVMLILYPILYPPNFTVHNVMAFVFGGAAAAVSWGETLKVWRMRPF